MSVSVRVAYPALFAFAALLNPCWLTASAYSQTAWQSAPVESQQGSILDLPPPGGSGAPQVINKAPQALIPTQPSVRPSAQRPVSSQTSPATQTMFPQQPRVANPVAQPSGMPKLPPPPPSRTRTTTAVLTQQPNNAPAGSATRNGPINLVGNSNPMPTATPSGSFMPGEILAVVGTEHLLAGEVLPFVEEIIEKNRSKIRSKSEEDKIRRQLVRQAMLQFVPTKALYQEFFRDMLGNKPIKDIREAKADINARISEAFFDQQVPQLFKQYKVKPGDFASLERELRKKSRSLMTLKQSFIEQILANELRRKYIPNEFEITPDEILRRYRKEPERWRVASKAKFRKVTVRFDRHANREEAGSLIQQLYNEILLGGKPFEAVAKSSSEGFNASNGGLYDWTTKGSLKSKEVDAVVFSIAPRQLSRIFEDPKGFHFVEVLERKDAHTQDMLTSQTEIRKELSDEKRQEAGKKFSDDIMKRTVIWTRWPEDIPGSRPLSDLLGAEAQGY